MVQFEDGEKSERDELSYPLLPDVAESSASDSHATIKRTGFTLILFVIFNLLFIFNTWCSLSQVYVVIIWTDDVFCSSIYLTDERDLSVKKAQILFFFFGCEGTVWTAVAHIINGVIGSGVLSLAWSVAQLGWIAGPLCIVVFGIICVFSSNLLCDCYRYPHPDVGHIRNRSYSKAVRSYLGNWCFNIPFLDSQLKFCF